MLSNTTIFRAIYVVVCTVFSIYSVVGYDVYCVMSVYTHYTAL